MTDPNVTILNLPAPIATQTNSAPNSQNQQTFSAIAKSQHTMFPKKEQAIVIDTIEGLPQIEYIKAIATIINVNHIRFASKISNNRFCIYLSSKEIVDHIITVTNYEIEIGSHKLKLRRLITPAIRIVLSNVSPTIPHEVIANTLTIKGLKLVSPMTFLRAGLGDEGFSHILSFRRQVYISEECRDIPDSILVQHDDSTYRLFLSTDGMKCYLCRQPGHLATQCPNGNDHSIVQNITLTKDDNPLEKNPSQADDISHKGVKRQASTSTASENQKEDKLSITTQNSNPLQKEPETDEPFKKPNQKPKKSKLSQSDSNLTQTIEEQLKPVEDLIKDDSRQYVLSYDLFKDLLENAYSTEDSLSVALSYTENVEGIINMINDIYPNLKHRSIKNRCTRIKNRLSQKQTSDSESSSSHSTY